MGLVDRLLSIFSKSESPPPQTFEQAEAIAQAELAEEYAQTKSEDISVATEAFSADEDELIPEIMMEPATEYDVGEIDAEELLSREADESHYEVNTADEVDLESADEHLVSADIIGDLPAEVSTDE